jgi:multicomponent Na+:H+ antiporter subunit E
MRTAIRFPAIVLWLAMLWVGLWAEWTVGTIIGGVLVAVGVIIVARPTGVTGRELVRFRPLAAVVYALNFLAQLVWSSLIVAWEVITPGSGLNRAIIGIPMNTRSDALITLVANSITLTPGTLTIEVHEPEDGSPTILYIHVLHFRDTESIRRSTLRLERLAVRAFGSPTEIAALEAATNNQGRTEP